MVARTGNPRDKQGGYVALLAVLVTGATALAISLAILDNSANTQRNVVVEQQSSQARSIARACAEEALQQIHDNTAFTGSADVTIGQDSCNYNVTSTGASTRSIYSTALAVGSFRKIQVYVTINASTISVTSWQEIP